MRGIARAALLALLAAAAVGCASLTDQPPPDLDGTTWVAVRVAGEQPAAAAAPSLTFDGEQITGNTGCNSFGAKVRIEGGRILVDGLGSTAIGCPEPIATVEQLFLNALGRATSIRYDGPNLVIDGGGGEIVLVETPVPGGIPVGT
jgi:heat shock protein HslJ